MTGLNFIFPYYHTVSDETLNHIRHVYPYRRISRFVKDLDYLLRHFRVADLDKLRKWQEDPGSVKEPHFFLSFDDGLREVHEVIAPLLVKKGIPAAIFVNTDFLDNKDLFYRYKTSLIIERLESVRFSPAVTEILQSRFNLPGKKEAHIRKFIRRIGYDRKDLLEEIAECLDLDFGAFLRVKRPYMSCSQVRELAGQGFRIGSHSLDHPEFSKMNVESQLSQFRESLQTVKREFGQEYGLFSFPYSERGVGQDFFDKISYPDEVMATFGTAGLKKDPLFFHHPRIPMELLRLPASQTLKGEYVYYLMKAAFRRNTVTR